MRTRAILLVLALSSSLACGRLEEKSASSASAGVSHADSATWVQIFDPSKAASGYTLAFHRRHVPVIFDMNGRVVHSWPESRVKSRLRLLKDGSLLAISRGRAIFEYDWDGNLVWEGRLPERKLTPHHDVIRLENGNTLMLALARGRPADELLEFDRDGELVWQWYAGDHLASYFGKRGREGKGDLTHINSVQELPVNPWFDQGDERFRPGNLLISARNLSTIFIIERATGEAVWSFRGELDYQHEALMIEPGKLGHGRILVFNNGYRRREERRSSILEIDPSKDSITWRYDSPAFFSPTGGIEQPLGNGNILVSSARGGRVFEITRQGEIVWQWTPPFAPNRPQRYSYDHCPQLAALAQPPETPVVAEPGYQHVDWPVYRFAMRQHRRTVEVNGQAMSLLRRNSICRELLLPEGATLEISYGFDSEKLRTAGPSAAATYLVTAEPVVGSTGAREVLRDLLDLSGESWRSKTVDLSEYGNRVTRICLQAEAPGSAVDRPTEEFVYWTNPRIHAADDARRQEATDQEPGDLTPEEQEVEMEHLRALGYVE
jgi:hypothetical protein